MKKNKNKKQQQHISKQYTDNQLTDNIKVIVVGLLAFILLFWLFPIYSFIALYLVVGLIIVSVNGNNNANLYIGGLVGISGSVFASVFMTVDKYIYYVNTMPMTANPDIPASLYTNTLFSLIKLSPLSYINPLLYIFISTVLCAAFTQLGLIKEIKKLAGGICVAVLVLNFLFVSLYSSRDLAQYASVEPPNLSYAYDAIKNIKTVYLMKNKGYYKAHVEAHYYDSRRIDDSQWTKESAQSGSRLFVRNPFIFYFWKYISLGDASRVLYLSILFCTALLPLSFLAAKKLVNEYALISPIVITPFLFIGTSWVNIFFPDWWAGLFLFAAVLFWLLKKYWFVSLFLLVSLLSREMIAFSYIIFLIAALLKERVAIKPLIVAGLVFAVLFVLNYVNAAQMFVDGKSSGIALNAVTGLYDFRLIPTSSYMMFLYGFFKFPVLVLFVIALLGSIFAKKLELILLVLYSLIHNSLAASSYWGNHFMLVVIFSLIFVLKIKPKINIKSS